MEKSSIINCILFGNGFNRLVDSNPSWSELLQNSITTSDFVKFSPPTLQYEFSLLQFADNKIPKRSIATSESEFKKSVAFRLSDIKDSSYIKDLKTCGVKLFLTPNFDNAFYGKQSHNILDSDSTEQLYSLHRWYKFNQDGKDFILYPYHGEICYPKTIELGYDHYCGAIGKIDKFLKGSYAFSSNPKKTVPPITVRLKNKSDYNLSDFKARDHGIPNFLSWIDAFFFTNLHIIGFGLDFSEIDVWWILNRRARIIADTGKKHIKNKIFYYPTDPVSSTDGLLLEKYRILRQYGVNVVPHTNITELSTGKIDFIGIYEEQLKNLRNNL